MITRVHTFKAALLLAVVAIGVADSALANCFKEKNGNIVVQVETARATDQWRKGTAVKGYTGGGYLTWFGPNEYDFRGKGILKFTVCATGGSYKVNLWSMRLNKPSLRNDEGNDCWILDGNKWTKLFTSFGDSMNTWKLSQDFDLDGRKVAPMINLRRGCQTFSIAARSEMFSLDRIVLQKSGKPLDMNSNGLKCSASGGGGRGGGQGGGQGGGGGKKKSNFRPRCAMGKFYKNRRGRKVKIQIRNKRKFTIKLFRSGRNGKAVAMRKIAPGKRAVVGLRKKDYLVVTKKGGKCLRRKRIFGARKMKLG